MPPTLSSQQIRDEILQCGKDPNYFIANYVRIYDEKKGLVPFNTFQYQKDLIKDYMDYRFTAVLKARQLGISTITQAYVLWLVLFHKGKNVLIIATKYNVASAFVRKTKDMYTKLPYWLKQIAKIADVNNRSAFNLTNDSMVKASTTSPDAGRSEALSLLVIDEAAHIERMEELWAALYPTLSSTKGKCVVISTPCGAGNFFHKVCTESKSGENDFHLVELPWDSRPDRDQAWYEKETKNMTQRDIGQELLCNFNMSGNTVISPEDMKKVFEHIQDPLYTAGIDRNLWVWEDYQPGLTYFISSDVARGDGEDFSAFHVFKVETMEIVAEYKGKITPDIFSEQLNMTGREYGECMIAVEINSNGYFVTQRLIEDLEYPNMYYSTKGSNEFIEQYAAEAMSNVVPGFSTTTKTRPLIIAKFEEMIRTRSLHIYSKRMYEELKTFIWNNAKPSAARHSHDDLIMACAIGCYIKDQVFATSLKDVEYKKAFMNAIHVSSTTLDTRIPGQQGYKLTKQDIMIQQGYYMGIYKG